MRSHIQFVLCVAGLCGVAQAQNTPTITSLNPSSLPLSSAVNGFTLAVLGTNFQSFCYVIWSDSAHLNSILATGFKNSTELDATVPMNYVTVAETATISVGCPGPVQSSPVSFTVGGSQSSGLVITTSATLVQGTVGAPYYQTLAASGGTPPYIWSALTALPPGLTLTQAGVLSGNPTTAAQYAFMVQVSDNSSPQLTAQQTFSLNVSAPGGTLTMSTTSLSAGGVGQAYMATLTAYGGNPPYTWTAAPGTTLPSWLSLPPSSDVLSGTPPSAGTYTVNVQVSDSASPAHTASRSFSLSVTAASSSLSITTPTTLPAGMVGVAYSPIMFAASGGMGPYTFVVFSGNTDGLAFGSDNLTFSGTPQSAGTFTFTVQAADSTGLQATSNFTLTVTGQTVSLTITTVGASTGTVGVAFSQSYTVVGGTAPYTWKITTGTVPGLTLNATASPVTLSGTPTQQGSFTVTLQATDANGAVGTRTFTITVAPGSLRISTSSQLPAATLGSAYTVQMAATGGTPPYAWSATGLPAGLTISSAGLIGGTIAAAGALSFVVTVTDSGLPPASVRNNFQITAASPALPAVTISGLPAAANPLAQYTVTIALASAYPVNITGMAILSSSPADNGPSDGSIQFSGGGKSANFTVNAGSASTTLAIQTGSVAGTVTLTLSQLTAGGVDVTPTPAPSAKTQMAGAAPVITAATVSRSGSTLTIQITGYATSRDMQQAVFTFGAATGQTLQTGASSITVQLSSLFSTYFQNSQYAAFGSQFVFSQPFTIQGDINSVIPQNVTLTNRVGSSTPAAVQ